MTEYRKINFTLNGEPKEAQVLTRLHVVDFLRKEYELSSPRVGCEHGVCGACTMRVNGYLMRGCLMLAVQVDGKSVETIEYLTQTGEIKDLQEKFIERNAMQCGYCTAGMLITAADLLKQDVAASREEIRDHLSGNYCRCTGYEAIVDSIEAVMIQRQQARKGAA